MERRLRGAWERLVVVKARLLDLTGHYPAEVRERRPGPGKWSMSGVVEHLVLVEEGLVTALAKEPSPARPRVVAAGRWYRFSALRIALKANVRITAPTEAILPVGGVPWHALLSRWDEARQRLEEWLISIDPAILTHPRFRHPIVGWLTVPQALTFAGDHLVHHIRQIRRIEQGRSG